METKMLSHRYWKTKFFAALYIIAMVLAIHDCLVIVTHTINPEILKDASPYILDKFLAALLAMFAL